MATFTFTYITRANGKPLTKNVSATDYKTALTKFETWAKQNCKAFCILAEYQM